MTSNPLLNMISPSLVTGYSWQSFKEAVIKPLLKEHLPAPRGSSQLLINIQPAFSFKDSGVSRETTAWLSRLDPRLDFQAQIGIH